MAFVDPVNVAASAPTPNLILTKVKFDGYGAEYWDTTNGYQFLVNHTTNSSGERHYMKMSQTLNATSPYTGLVSKQTANVSLSASFPSFGWDASTKAALIKALTDALVDADVTVARFVGFQS